MKIAAVRTKALSLRMKEPYYWSQGVYEAASVVLVEIESDTGVVGIGESVGPPPADVMTRIIAQMSERLIGQSPFEIARLNHLCYQGYFPAAGGDAPRTGNRVLTGIELALWDLIGKATGEPLHHLLGGAVHDSVGYFAFLQGDSADELADSARAAVQADAVVVYMKIGRGEVADLENVAAVRDVIGGRRLRLDPNEAWDPVTAVRMIGKLERFDPEFIEQPTPAHSIEALAHVKRSVRVPLAADQCVYTPADVYEVCRRGAADLIVLGLHEAGGVLGLRKAAAIAEAAGLNVCIHGVFESGITTCASNQVAATLPNLDDGNQIMWQLLERDIVASPSLVPVHGRLATLTGPGLGFELDAAAVAAASED